MWNQSGFTLVEAVFCMVIFVLLSMISIPAIGAWKETAELRSEVTLLVAHMQRAKIEAVTKNCCVVFLFDTDRNSYSLFVDNGAGGGIAKDWIRQSGERQLNNHLMNRNISLESTTLTNKRTRFRPALGNKAGRLVLANRKGQKFGVVLSRLGRVRVERM